MSRRVLFEVAPEGAVILPVALPAEQAVFVDSDWVPSEGSAVPTVTATRSPDAAVRVAAAFAATALEVVQLVEGIQTTTGDRVAANGRGLLAWMVRSLLDGREPPDRDGRASIIVETTGRAEAIRRALREVADLGTVVLTGESVDDEIGVDLYGDVHRRGLRVVGVSPVTVTAAPRVERPHVVADAVARLRVCAAIPRGDGALWYRLEPAC